MLVPTFEGQQCAGQLRLYGCVVLNVPVPLLHAHEQCGMPARARFSSQCLQCFDLCTRCDDESWREIWVGQVEVIQELPCVDRRYSQPSPVNATKP